MNVLSLFDGMSCGMIALDRAGIRVSEYYSSEIDKHAIKVSEANYPQIKRLGDVQSINYQMLPGIDLLIGGSPCQGFSLAGKGLNFTDPRSALFFEFVHALKTLKPKYFLLENVKMKKEIQDAISKLLGCQPIKINSALVSAQNRVRLYWTNIPGVAQPEDRDIKLVDILDLHLKSCKVGLAVRDKSKCVRVGGRNSPIGSKQEWDSPFQRISKNGTVKPSIKKAACLTSGANSGGNHSDMDILHSELFTRRYSITECERLQSVPDGYTQNKGVSNSQCYKMLGNGWTVDVIAHIFKGLLT